MNPSPLRDLPAVQTVLRHPIWGQAALPRWAMLEAAREVIEAARGEIQRGGASPGLEELAARALDEARRKVAPTLRRVINATGVVLHTNLGRAPLGERALERVVEVARGYSTLEYDLDRGRRGSRQIHASALLRRLTGAEAAMVVNNNAAAVFLTLTALAAGREVIVSRGELVEIGGSFRVPDIMAAGGARLREVGTTNRTRLADYERALTPDTALILKVHPSNFRIQGFTEQAPLGELAELAHGRGLPLVYDLGSGCLDDERLGGEVEPGARTTLEAGVDLVTFSGDKLLGGPQAGLIAGKRALVERLRTHPLARALRVDKLTLAALEGTLASWLEGSQREQVPVARALHTPLATLEARAHALKARLEGQLPLLAGELALEVVHTQAHAGGGSLPEVPLPSWAVALRPLTRPAQSWEEALRGADPPVVARIEDGRLLLDVRTLLPGDDDAVVRGLSWAAGAPPAARC